MWLISWRRNVSRRWEKMTCMLISIWSTHRKTPVLWPFWNRHINTCRTSGLKLACRRTKTRYLPRKNSRKYCYSSKLRMKMTKINRGTISRSTPQESWSKKWTRNLTVLSRTRSQSLREMSRPRKSRTVLKIPRKYTTKLLTVSARQSKSNPIS